MNKKSKLNNRGTSLVEALIAMLIMSFVIVSILSGFSQQQLRSRSMSERAVAMQLAEIRMEELLKFPTPQLQDQNTPDYIIVSKDGFVVSVDDPNQLNQFRRTTTIAIDAMGQIADLRVRVDYPFSKNDIYPFHVEISSRRGVK